VDQFVMVQQLTLSLRNVFLVLFKQVI
jgi:hypothetical protein